MYAIEVSITLDFRFKTDLYRAAGLLHRGNSESTSMCLLLPYRCVLVSLFFFLLSSIIRIQYSQHVLLLSFPHCSEVMSPWHESRERSCIPPAGPSTGWPVGRMEFSAGMDSQQSIYLHLIIWQLQGRESRGSTIPSWCLICHSFSYWIFLFKAALLMLQPQHPCSGRGGRGTSAGFKQEKVNS